MVGAGVKIEEEVVSLNKIRLAAFVVGMAFAAGVVLAQAPNPVAEALRKEAESAFQAEDYKTASEKFGEFKKKFPADGNLWVVVFQLGQAYSLDGQHDKAQKEFEDLRKLPITRSDEQKELIAFWLFRVAGGRVEKAAASGDTKKRDAAYATAEKAYEDFIKGFSKTKLRTESLFYIAMAREQAEKFTEAKKAYKDVIAVTAQSALAADRQLAQSATYKIASVLLKESKAAKRANKTAEAEKFRDEARKQFDEVLVKAKQVQNYLLINEMNFRVGMIWFEDEEFNEAIVMLRLVRPKSELLAYQTAVVQSLESNPLTRTNADLKARLDTAKQMKENIAAAPDPFIIAYDTIARAYIRQQLSHEAYTITRHLLPHATDKMQRKQVQLDLISSLLGLSMADAARDEFAKWQEDFKNDEGGDHVSYLIAQLYIQQRPSRYDEARAQYKKSQVDYPTGRFFAGALLGEAMAYPPSQAPQMLEALKKIEKRIENEKELAAEFAFQLAQAYYGLGKYAEAAAQYRVVKEKHSGYPNRPVAALQIGISTLKAGKPNEAIVELQKFITDFPENKDLTTDAYFQIANATEMKASSTMDLKLKNETLDDAVKQYRAIIGRDPKGPRAPDAQIKVAAVYSAKQDWIAMSNALTALTKEYPESPLVPTAYFYLGQDLVRQKLYDKAVEQFEMITKKFPDSPNAPDAHLEIGNAWKKSATDMGLPQGLLPEKLAIWQERVAKAIAAYETTLQKFPDRPQADVALSSILSLQSLRLAAKLIAEKDVSKYFDDLAKKFSGNRILRIKIAFAGGKLIRDPAESLKIFDRLWTESDKENLPLGIGFYEEYAKRLAVATPPQFDKAVAAWAKMFEVAADNETRARALIGRAEPLTLQKKYGDAEKLLDRVIKEFDKTKAVPSAHLGKAYILDEQNKPEAIDAYKKVLETAKGELLAKGTFRIANAYLKKKDDASAFVHFRTMVEMFSTFAESAESAYRCGEILERTPAIATAQKTTALNFYNIAIRYKNSPMAEKAAERIKALSAKK